MAVSKLVSSTTPSGPLAWTVLSRVNATSGLTISFTGLSGYKSYRLVAAGLKQSTGGTEQYRIRLNGDSSSIYATFGVIYRNGSTIPIQSINDNGIQCGIYNLGADIPVYFDCTIQAADQATMKIANVNFYDNSSVASYSEYTTNVPLGVTTSIVLGTSNASAAFAAGTVTLLGGN
jgi:hypothetical protein